MHRKYYFSAMVILATVALLAIQPGAQKLRAAHGTRSAAARRRPMASPIQRPLGFEANAGQADPRAKFVAHGSGYTLFLASDEAVLALSTPATRGETRASDSRLTPPPARRQARSKRLVPAAPSITHLVRMKLRGANSSVRVAGLEELPGKSNYFLGNDPEKWRTGVPNYAKVKYQGVYPGIDLVYYGNQQQLEYDFVVAPGANPNEIRFDLSEASGGPAKLPEFLRIDRNGDLVLPTGDGDLHLEKPTIYQTAQRGQRIPVDGHFAIRDRQQVGFEIASYDHTQPLVIDPTVVFSTYLGGNGMDGATGIAVDTSVNSFGNEIVTGTTTSTNLPLGAPIQGALNGPENVFVSELNPGGTVLIFSTYIGGSGYDTAYGIAVNSVGDIYVAGSTTSTDFPTVTPFQGTMPGTAAQTGFMFWLTTQGASLAYSTYLGGSVSDYCFGVATDNIGRVYLTGETDSPDFPTTSNAAQTSFQNGNPNPAGPYDAFLAVFFPVLGYQKSLLYSSFLGGSNTDFGQAISVDYSSYDVYITGGTYSTDFPTRNGFQGSNPSGNPLAFVTRFSPQSPQSSTWGITYSTYLGGDLAVGNAVVASSPFVGVGGLTSTNFPVVNPVQGTFGGGDSTSGPLEDGFVAWFDTSQGSQASLLASTYMGGAGNDSVTGISGTPGAYWVVGSTDSSNFPTSTHALQPTYGGNRDAFVAGFALSATGPSKLLYSSYLGGSGTESGLGIAGSTGVNGGTIWVTGSTGSRNFPTFNPFQSGLLGSQNAFVTRIHFAPGATVLPIPSINVAVGASGSATVTAQSIDAFQGVIQIGGLSGLPAGLSWTPINQINVPLNGTGSATLKIAASSVATPGTYSLQLDVSNDSFQMPPVPITVNVTTTTAAVQGVVGSLQGAGCIDNSGIAYAMSSKLAAAQAAANARQIQNALNTYNALLYEIRTQSGKHIANACTVGGNNVSPSVVLSNDVHSLIAGLKLIGSADPILGYVVNSGDVGVAGVTLGLFNSAANLVVSTSTDATGFYYFAGTSTLAAGANYSVHITRLPQGYRNSAPPSQSFSWRAAPVALTDFTLN